MFVNYLKSSQSLNVSKPSNNKYSISNPIQLGTYSYKESLFLNENVENIDPNVVALAKLDYSNFNRPFDLLQGFKLEERLQIFKDPKQEKFLEWIIANNTSDEKLEFFKNKNSDLFGIDIVSRRKILSDILLVPFIEDAQRLNVCVSSYKNTIFINEQDNKKLNFIHSEATYAGVVFRLKLTGFKTSYYSNKAINDSINHVSVSYREFNFEDNKQKEKIKILVANQLVCKHNEEKNEYCEVKCARLFDLWRPNDAISQWWNRREHEIIKRRKLKNLIHRNDRNYVVDNLIGLEKLKAFWAQSFVNNSKYLVVGFYKIHSPKYYNYGRHQFLVDSIIEIEIDDIEFYLKTKLCSNFVEISLKYLQEFLCKIKEDFEKNRITSCYFLNNSFPKFVKKDCDQNGVSHVSMSNTNDMKRRHFF